MAKQHRRRSQGTSKTTPSTSGARHQPARSSAGFGMSGAAHLASLTQDVESTPAPLHGWERNAARDGYLPGQSRRRSEATPAGLDADEASTEPEVTPVSPFRCRVVDENALLREPPPSLEPIGGRLPVGQTVEVIGSTRANGSEFAHVEQIVNGRLSGQRTWTLVSNLENLKEQDDTMVPEQQIPLDNLSGLDRSMAEIFNERGLYIEQNASSHGVTESDVAGVLQIESGGQAFGATTGVSVCRFEVHVFWSEWGQQNRALFDKHFRFSRSGPSWTGHRWRPTEGEDWREFHGAQAREVEVLEFARTLDESAAIRSASFGAGQIMGFNHRLLGFDTPVEMLDAFNDSVRAQLDGMFAFFENTSALRALRRRNYLGFATAYNGSGKAAEYAGLIQQAVRSYERVRPLAE